MLFISDFMRDFHAKLHEVTPEEVKRDLSKHERVVKHALYMVMGQTEHFVRQDAAKFQEMFHVRIDQMASDYRTWKRAGCKPYARPKQYVSGRVAGASKKAFDQVLNTYLLKAKMFEYQNQEEFLAVQKGDLDEKESPKKESQRGVSSFRDIPSISRDMMSHHDFELEAQTEALEEE